MSTTSESRTSWRRRSGEVPTSRRRRSRALFPCSPAHGSLLPARGAWRKALQPALMAVLAERSAPTSWREEMLPVAVPADVGPGRSPPGSGHQRGGAGVAHPVRRFSRRGARNPAPGSRSYAIRRVAARQRRWVSRELDGELVVLASSTPVGGRPLAAALRQSTTSKSRHDELWAGAGCPPSDAGTARCLRPARALPGKVPGNRSAGS